MKKTFVRVLAVSIAALLFAGCSSEAKTDATIKESWLFSLQSAGTTSFDQSSGVLSMPIDDVVGFTDRPNREARDITSTAFVSMWADKGGDSFSADPPNASLTYWDSDGTNAVAHTVIVEITGNVSNAGNVLSMTLQILSPSGAVLPTKLYRASLFVDNWGAFGCDVLWSVGNLPYVATPAYANVYRKNVEACKLLGVFLTPPVVLDTTLPPETTIPVETVPSETTLDPAVTTVAP